MSNQIIIKQPGCIMVLYQNELYQLPKDILLKALRRGKGLKRVNSNLKRQAQGFDRWELYECLKGNRHIDSVLMQWVEVMPEDELKSGVIEYLDAMMRA